MPRANLLLLSAVAGVKKSSPSLTQESDDDDAHDVRAEDDKPAVKDAAHPRDDVEHTQPKINHPGRCYATA